MNSVEVLKALERERELLEDFICLSEEQLLLLEDENIEAVNTLLQKRADLMIELTAIEATLGTWISQIRTDPSVTAEMRAPAQHLYAEAQKPHIRFDLKG